eukprot:COSAG02_NODE_1911_length_10408_cov_1015.930449_4_plen_229_part_00
MPDTSTQAVDMDSFPEAAKVIERLQRDHDAELDEQLKLFAESQQKPTEFLEFADTVEFLIEKLKDDYCNMYRAFTTLQRQLPTECQKYYQPTYTYEWYQKDGGSLTADEVQDAEAYLRECEQQIRRFKRIRELQTHMKKELNRALKKPETIPHRAVVHLLLSLEHDFVWDSCMYGNILEPYCADDLNRYIFYLMNCRHACDKMIDILWDKSLTVAIQCPSKRRRIDNQ